MQILSSTKNIKETEDFWNRFFDIFSKIWKMGAIYKVDKMGERTDSCSISVFVLKERETKLFHI